MNCLIILSLAVATAQAQFFLQDSPDVAAAKAAHFAEHAKAAALVGAPLQDVYRSSPTGFSSFSAPVVTPQGFLSDTPEVASAKAAHLAEHARAAAASAPATSSFATQFDSPVADPYAEYRAYYNRYYANLGRSGSVYTGPQAMPTVLPSGFLADTSEVAHAKATHLYKHYQEATRL